MDELSMRMTEAVLFLERNGYAKNHISIARKIGVSASTITMAMSGSRPPGGGLLLKFCDAYPINCDWLRTGTGSIIRSEREIALLKRIEELEGEIRHLLAGQGSENK